MRYVIINEKIFDIYKANHIKNTDYRVASCTILEQNLPQSKRYFMVAKLERLIALIKILPLEGRIDLTGKITLLTEEEFAERIRQVESLQQKIEQILGSPEKSWKEAQN